jgi:HPt (histidine-containing phosphotransfer) domain-containing protein
MVTLTRSYPGPETIILTVEIRSRAFVRVAMPNRLQVAQCPNDVKNEPQIFNRRKIHAFTLGDARLEGEILELFVKQLAEVMATLQSATDPVLWHRAAHTLRGSAATVGADAIAAIAIEATSFAPRKSDQSIEWAVKDGETRARQRVGHLDRLERAARQFSITCDLSPIPR